MDLAQPPTIVWRDKQVIVEETPVLEAVREPTVRKRTPDATGKRRRQQIAGDRSPQFSPSRSELDAKRLYLSVISSRKASK
jgi:hypothetical protein